MTEEKLPFSDEELSEIGEAIGTIAGAVDLVLEGRFIFPMEINLKIKRATDSLRKYNFSDDELLILFAGAFGPQIQP
jgi:hypothetical protein